MTIPGNGDESDDENMLGENGDAEVNPDDDNGHDSDLYPEESVEEVNEPSTFRGMGCGGGRKMQCCSGCGGGRG